jgi:hypothetical protein
VSGIYMPPYFAGGIGRSGIPVAAPFLSSICLPEKSKEVGA